MKRKSIQHLNLWQFEALAEEVAVRHFVTDRHSHPAQADFTLGYSNIIHRERARQNRAHLASAMGIKEQHLYLPMQVHRTNIVTVTAQTTMEQLNETDALITHEKGLCIAVMSADCVPILLYDKKNRVVAAVHSGWRGTVARILEKTLTMMDVSFGTKGADVIAGIGPSVSQESYEVGEEVIQSVHETFGQQENLLIHQSNNKARLDLWKANKLQLINFGVPESNIEIADLCTVKNNDYFFSARKGDTGRFAAGIMLC